MYTYFEPHSLNTEHTILIAICLIMYFGVLSLSAPEARAPAYYYAALRCMDGS